jgi:hypothetical protein
VVCVGGKRRRRHVCRRKWPDVCKRRNNRSGRRSDSDELRSASVVLRLAKTYPRVREVTMCDAYKHLLFIFNALAS